jgi:putative lipoic acid-binding regulatory protein
MDNKPATQSPLTFPCDFVIKVFGHKSDEFEVAALTIIRNHIKDLREDALSFRPSKDGKYIALTVTVHVESKEQLDNIYRDLTANPLVLMAL